MTRRRLATQQRVEWPGGVAGSDAPGERAAARHHLDHTALDQAAHHLADDLTADAETLCDLTLSWKTDTLGNLVDQLLLDPERGTFTIGGTGHTGHTGLG